MIIDAVMTGAVRGGTSIPYASVGETISERSGVINLGIEGSMLCGALAAYAAGIASGSPWVEVIAGMCAGALLAAVHASVVLFRHANQIATGLVVTFLGIGLTGLFGQAYVGKGVVALSQWPIPGLCGGQRCPRRESRRPSPSPIPSRNHICPGGITTHA